VKSWDVFQSRAIRGFNPEESVGFMAKRFIPNPTYEEIAPWAHWIYESRGRKPGSELEDWLEAEAQLIADPKQEAGLANRKTNNERRALWENASPAGTPTTNHSKS
jgi:DUF2934 family protein